MANPWAGEVAVVIDGKSHACKLTLGALAELEGNLGEGSLIELIRRFENGGFSGKDVMSIIVAGLRGCGWTGTGADLLTAEIEGGAIGAAKSAANLLTRAFTPPT